MSRFPTVDALAVAGDQEVLSAWQGLGYYSRARRLHAAARRIIDKHQGDIPEAESDLLALPGVGVYTAAAVRAFAHDHSAEVLDTNIIRVLARWSNMSQSIDTANGRKALALSARAFFPKSGCRDIASALMDLGAMVCKTGVPACNACPLQKTCLAVDPSKIPSKAPRPVTTKRIEHRGWFLKKGLLYLEQSSGPLWPGLWILPKLGNLRPSGRAIVTITYPITRYRVSMRVFPSQGKIPQGLRGFALKEVADLPVPSPHRRAIAVASLTGHNDT
jgi:A/G-specific adenine glycosylase